MKEMLASDQAAGKQELRAYRIGDLELQLQRPETAFEPNTTTHKIASVLRGLEGADCLDLGCGVGPLAIYCALKGARRIDAVDACARSCEAAKRNVQRHRTEQLVRVLAGDLYSPVQDESYDLIIDDVSGLASEVAAISGWYPPQIQSGGRDGTDLVIRVLKESPRHLRHGGRIVFPVLSLSASHRVIACANEVFGDGFRVLSTSVIPFPQSLVSSIASLDALREEGMITFWKRGERYVWRLSICEGVRPV